jgi:DNA mismatch repair protein MutL
LPKQTSLFSLQEDRVANESLVYKLKTPGDFPDSSLPFAQQKVRGESVPNFYVLGQIGKLFIVYAVGNDLYLADGHALHERMNFDKLSARLDERELDYQELLTPLVFDIGAVDSEKVLAMAKTFEGLGLFFEDFGGGKIKLDRVPDYLGRGHSQKIISGLLSEVLEVPLKNRSELREKALSTMACRMSIMSGDALTRELMEDLISQLYEKDYVHLCPHGRPFVKKISFAEMCVFFGREAKVENETV